MAGWFYNNEHITWNKENVGWVVVELAQVLEDKIYGTVPASKISSFITLELISSSSIPAAPANLTERPSRQEQPKFNSQIFVKNQLPWPDTGHGCYTSSYSTFRQAQLG